MNAAGNSDDNAADNTAQANSPERAESLTPGELLRRERERRALPQLHIAEELHLDVRMVAAIEANRFGELGVPVYARGHLRQYAALLGLSPQFIIERYEALTGPQDIPAPLPSSVAVGTSVGMEQRSLAGPLWMGVALIAMLLGWWIWSAVSDPGDPMQAALQEESQADETSRSRRCSTNQRQCRARRQLRRARRHRRQELSGCASSSRMPRGPRSTTPRARRLMFGLGESGRVRDLSGTPPLRVTLGKASAVTVQVNDRPIVVPRRAGGMRRSS